MRSTAVMELSLGTDKLYDVAAAGEFEKCEPFAYEALPMSFLSTLSKSMENKRLCDWMIET